MPPSYNISEMKYSLESAMSQALGDIKSQFETFLTKITRSSSNSSSDELLKNRHVGIYRLEEHESLNEIYSSQGFYAICTDHVVPGNSCKFVLDDSLRAIYRGECSSVRRRIESHLFNQQYKDSYESRKNQKLASGGKFSEPYYGACIKIDPEVSGINIDSGEYAQNKWVVLVLKMYTSNSLIRKQAELAFDAAFGKPVASRE